MAVLLETSKGDMVIDLYVDECPRTTKNFLKLCKLKYYNNVLFHAVTKDFVVQTGDPTGTGKGGDSVYTFLYGDQARFFEDEIRPSLRHKAKGTVSMASAGENLNASQFLITAREDCDALDERNTVFGQVSEGLDVLDDVATHGGVLLARKRQPAWPAPPANNKPPPPQQQQHQHQQQDRCQQAG